jgi:hypothetical protein
VLASLACKDEQQEHATQQTMYTAAAAACTVVQHDMAATGPHFPTAAAFLFKLQLSFPDLLHSCTSCCREQQQ